MTMEMEQSDTLKELAQVRAESRGQVRGETAAELPQGATPVEAAPPVEAVAETQEVAPTEEVELIKIGDKEFKSEREAIEYAKQLEQEKLISEAYNSGIRETLAATAPKEEKPPEEDKFEEEFYSNPKETLKKVKDQAAREALAAVQAEQRKEALWTKFLGENPDIERRDAERILAENYEIIGKITDIDKGMKLLAQKTRAEYQRIAEKFAPRKELPNKGGQVVSAGSAAPQSVTLQRKNDQPLDFGAQLRSIRRR